MKSYSEIILNSWFFILIFIEVSKPALDRMKDNGEGISKSVYFQTL